MREWLALAGAALLLLVAGCPAKKDTVSPTVTFTSPAAGDTLLPDTNLVVVHATDNKAVTFVKFYLDSVEFARDSTADNGDYKASWDATADSMGATFELKAEAFDSAGNVGRDSIAVVVRRTGGGPKYHGGALPADQVWYPTGNPHICTTAVVVDAGHKLTILPGCVLKFRSGAGITVGQGTSGQLVAVGNADSLIEFTSDASTPAPGDWTGIAFQDKAGASRLSFCRLDYGGRSGGGTLAGYAGGQFSADNCTISNSSGSGLYCGLDGHPSDFSHNTVTGCSDYPIRLSANSLVYLGTGNTLTGNAAGMDAIYVTGSPVGASATWRNCGVPYIISGDVVIGVMFQSAPTIVTIEPGTTIKLGLDTQILVGDNMLAAALTADATGGQPITFTSAEATPGRGDWRNIYFSLGSLAGDCRLKNCRFVYGGRDLTGEVYLNNVNADISGCAVDSSAGYGIYLEGDPGELPDPAELRANNTFSGNALGNIFGP